MFERQIIELSRNAMAVVAIDLHAGKLTVDPVERAANFCQSGPYVIRRHLRCHSSTNLPHVDRAQRAWSSSRPERRRRKNRTTSRKVLLLDWRAHIRRKSGICHAPRRSQEARHATYPWRAQGCRPSQSFLRSPHSQDKAGPTPGETEFHHTPYRARDGKMTEEPQRNPNYDNPMDQREKPN